MSEHFETLNPPEHTKFGELRPVPVFLLFFVLIGSLYFATADRGRTHSVDALTNTLAAWKWGTEGEPYVDENLGVTGGPYAGRITWLVEANGHAVSKFPPGTALLAAPAYAIANSDGEEVDRKLIVEGSEPVQVTVILPSFVPGVLTAALATAAAMALLGLVFARFVSVPAAVGAALTAALGTTAWSVASNSLWQHGPAMMWLAAALFFLSRHRQWPAGLMLGLSILTRPQTAVIAAVLGVVMAWKERSVWPAFRIAAGSLAGLGAYLFYNRLVFGHFGVPAAAGGYFVDSLGSGSVGSFPADLGRVFFDLERGVLLYTPFLLVLIPGVRRAWKAAPNWVQGAAIGGLAYVVVQLRGNVWHGGDGFFAYRYPLEMLLVVAPLMLLAWRDWSWRTRFRRLAVRYSSAVAIVVHAVGAVAL